MNTRERILWVLVAVAMGNSLVLTGLVGMNTVRGCAS